MQPALLPKATQWSQMQQTDGIYEMKGTSLTETQSESISLRRALNPYAESRQTSIHVPFASHISYLRSRLLLRKVKVIECRLEKNMPPSVSRPIIKGRSFRS